jgi:methanol dehydrogenase (cytochrome c) subunit 2
MKNGTLGLALLFGLCVAPVAALAYDGTNCKAPGNCWEPKPGFPDKVAGSKYDPKHDPKEVAKQQASIEAMEGRNKKRVAHFKKTGKWEYDVTKIPADADPAEPAAQAPAPAAPAQASQAPGAWVKPSN